MVFEFFRGGSDHSLEEIEATIADMLLTNRHTFDLAINSVIGGTDARAVDSEVHKSDRSVNKMERRIRKELVVHISVHGKAADLPRVLVAMSVIKDAERIGDYAKNIWDIADAGVDLSDAGDLDELMAVRDRTSQLLGDCARIYKERDTAAVHELIPQMEEWMREYDTCLVEQIGSTSTPREAVPRVLLCRYHKRITAHSLNIISSLVMPVHRLDYYDEKKADREP
ncbi:MAG: PhoU domain-containing protein [Actinobacteria bacterium]|nr:PhoU domain-containing protein [Actinomycetota bacterium]